MNYSGMLDNALDKQCATASPLMPRSLSVLEEKNVELERAEREVARLKELISLMEKHPDIDRMLMLLGGRY